MPRRRWRGLIRKRSTRIAQFPIPRGLLLSAVQLSTWPVNCLKPPSDPHNRKGTGKQCSREKKNDRSLRPKTEQQLFAPFKPPRLVLQI